MRTSSDGIEEFYRKFIRSLNYANFSVRLRFYINVHRSSVKLVFEQILRDYTTVRARIVNNFPKEINTLFGTLDTSLAFMFFSHPSNTKIRHSLDYNIYISWKLPIPSSLKINVPLERTRWSLYEYRYVIILLCVITYALVFTVTIDYRVENTETVELRVTKIVPLKFSLMNILDLQKLSPRLKYFNETVKNEFSLSFVTTRQGIFVRMTQCAANYSTRECIYPQIWSSFLLRMEF